jgi:hypothetical protein
LSRLKKPHEREHRQRSSDGEAHDAICAKGADTTEFHVDLTISSPVAQSAAINFLNSSYFDSLCAQTARTSIFMPSKAPPIPSLK